MDVVLNLANYLSEQHFKAILALSIFMNITVDAKLAAIIIVITKSASEVIVAL